MLSNAEVPPVILRDVPAYIELRCLSHSVLGCDYREPVKGLIRKYYFSIVQVAINPEAARAEADKLAAKAAAAEAEAAARRERRRAEKAARKEAERRARKEQKHLERCAHLEKLTAGCFALADARCLPSPHESGAQYSSIYICPTRAPLLRWPWFEVYAPRRVGPPWRPSQEEMLLAKKCKAMALPCIFQVGC